MKKKDNKNNKNLYAALGLGLIAAVLVLLNIPVFYDKEGKPSLSLDEIEIATDANAVWTGEAQTMHIVEKAFEKKSLWEILTGGEKSEEILEETTPEITETETAALLSEPETVAFDAKDAHDEKYANEFVTKERGNSDEFFQGTENQEVYLNFGMGDFNISDCVEKWMYGEPIVNLNKIAEVMGLKLSTVQPDGFIKLPKAESYWPGDEPILDEQHRYDIYLVSPQGESIRYQTGSTIQEDSNYYAYLNLFQVEGYKDQDYKTLVSISEIPYYDGETMKAGMPAKFKYSDDRITITFGDPKDSTGILMLEDVQELTEEEYRAMRESERESRNETSEQVN